MQVDVAAVPPGISLATAEAVLFIGKAARVLRKPPGRPATNPGHGPYQALASRASPVLQPSGAGRAGATHGGAGGELAAGPGVWREAGSAGEEWVGMRQRWAAELRRLAAAPAFSALDFERTVEGIRTQARPPPHFIPRAHTPLCSLPSDFISCGAQFWGPRCCSQTLQEPAQACLISSDLVKPFDFLQVRCLRAYANIKF